MFDEEVEHDGLVHRTTTSTVAFEEKTKDEPLKEEKAGSVMISYARKEVSNVFPCNTHDIGTHLG